MDINIVVTVFTFIGSVVASLMACLKFALVQKRSFEKKIIEETKKTAEYEKKLLFTENRIISLEDDYREIKRKYDGMDITLYNMRSELQLMSGQIGQIPIELSNKMEEKLIEMKQQFLFGKMDS